MKKILIAYSIILFLVFVTVSRSAEIPASRDATEGQIPYNSATGRLEASAPINASGGVVTTQVSGQASYLTIPNTELPPPLSAGDCVFRIGGSLFERSNGSITKLSSTSAGTTLDFSERSDVADYEAAPDTGWTFSHTDGTAAITGGYLRISAGTGVNNTEVFTQSTGYSTTENYIVIAKIKLPNQVITDPKGSNFLAFGIRDSEANDWINYTMQWDVGTAVQFTNRFKIKTDAGTQSYNDVTSYVPINEDFYIIIKVTGNNYEGYINNNRVLYNGMTGTYGEFPVLVNKITDTEAGEWANGAYFYIDVENLSYTPDSIEGVYCYVQSIQIFGF